MSGLIRGVVNFLPTLSPVRWGAVKWAQYRNPITSSGVTIDISDPVVHHQIPRLVFRQYEREIHSFIKNHLDPSVPVVEFGGGLGYISSAVNQKQDDGVQQIVVEPNPDILPVLERTRELNEAQFIIEKKAYSTTADAVEFNTSGDFTRSSVGGDMESIEVETVALADIIDKYCLNECGLIVDMEGAEIELIEEELQTVIDYCPFVIIEYHTFEGMTAKVQKARRTFEDAGYDLVDERGGTLKKCVYRRQDNS
ncbi:FkbM family methyltransferase [Halobacterium sp. MBLA0001]|uniref:FkbM family methyltransferase n=1 Tax=Halobacterium sp. MBLA0001 TaxID=3413511 RepID=UPI003C716400